MATASSSLPPGFEGVAMGPPLPSHHHVVQTNQPKHARETKKVSWAPEDIICQVRLFAAEDAPSQSSTVRQDLLQAKKTKFLHPANLTVPVDIPPGFGPSAPKETEPVVAVIIAQISWRNPESFILDPTWKVMAGGASQEVSVQRQRENRILEAVYPRPSAIPESPAEPLEPQLPYDDTKTPIIPVVPLEEDDLPDQDDFTTISASSHDALTESATPEEHPPSPPPGFGAMTKTLEKSRHWFPEVHGGGTLGTTRGSISLPLMTSPLGLPLSTSRNTPLNGTPVAIPNALHPLKGSVGHLARSNEAEPDVVAAAAAAYAALAQSNDTTMIDRDLLIQFLTNPSILQTLSDKLAANPPANHVGVECRSNENVEQQGGIGARPNGRSWNPSDIEQVRGEVSVRCADNHSGALALPADGAIAVGHDRPPGFGPSASLGSLSGTSDSRLPTGLGQATQQRSQAGPRSQAGQGFPIPSRPVNGQSMTPASIPPPLSAGQLPALGSGRPLISQRDEQYYKDLISQHGRKDDDEYWAGTTAMDTGNSYPGSGRPRTMSSDIDRRSERLEGSESEGRWSGREDMEFAGLSLRQGDMDSRSGQSRGKSRKACIYFSTSRGCRNGPSCAFVHESTNAERAKRPKLEGKESGKGYR